MISRLSIARNSQASAIYRIIVNQATKKEPPRKNLRREARNPPMEKFSQWGLIISCPI